LKTPETTQTKTVFKPFPHYIKVTKNADGTLNVKTNTHLIENVPPDNLAYLAYPYAGVGATLELDCADEELKQAIYLELEKNTDLYPYLDDEHPVLINAYSNWVYAFSNFDRFKSIRSLCKSAKGRDILFLGAGPSLHANADLIKQLVNENKVICIAGGSAIRQCSKLGIFPHLALAFDPRFTEQTVVFDYLSDEFIERVPFVTNQGLYHNCFKRLKTAYMTCSSSLPDLCQWLEPEEWILPEGRIGVSTMVPFLADLMCANRLIYIGVDLRYTEDGKRYADIDDNQRAADSQDFEGVDTRLAWIREAVNVEQNQQHIDTKLFNASDISLFNKVNLPYLPLTELLKNETHKFEVNTVDKQASAAELIEKLNILLSQFEGLAAKNQSYKNDPELRDTDAFKWVVATYDMLQQFREVRTGDYNHCLLKHFIKNNINWLKQALAMVDNVNSK
jgi:hypothetical protein